MPNQNVRAVVGRDGLNRIIVDVTSLEAPAVTLRTVFDDPEAAMRFADELSEHANDDTENRAGYPDYFARSDAEERAARAEDAGKARREEAAIETWADRIERGFGDIKPLTPGEEQSISTALARIAMGGAL